MEEREQGGDVRVSGKVEDQTSCRILDELEWSNLGCQKASQEGVVVVQAGQNHRLD